MPGPADDLESDQESDIYSPLASTVFSSSSNPDLDATISDDDLGNENDSEPEVEEDERNTGKIVLEIEPNTESHSLAVSNVKSEERRIVQVNKKVKEIVYIQVTHSTSNLSQHVLTSLHGDIRLGGPPSPGKEN
jgi:hypothetical protein